MSGTNRISRVSLPDSSFQPKHSSLRRRGRVQPRSPQTDLENVTCVTLCHHLRMSMPTSPKPKRIASPTPATCPKLPRPAAVQIHLRRVPGSIGRHRRHGRRFFAPRRLNLVRPNSIHFLSFLEFLRVS